VFEQGPSAQDGPFPGGVPQFDAILPRGIIGTRSLKQVKMMPEGKIKKQMAKDFLNKL
jgi:hypothetical protein